MVNSASTQLIVALDFGDLQQAMTLVDRLGDSVSWYKIGSQLFTTFGPEAVRQIKNAGKRVFLDLKFHDIPNTVSAALTSAMDLRVDMTNVHAAGGREMLEQAARTVRERNTNMILLAVTVLTSVNNGLLEETGVPDTVRRHVVRLASLAQACGVHGVVASAHEIEDIRRSCGPDFVLVVPGVRPSGTESGDQKRVATPAYAALHRCTFIVVGRPITEARDPVQVAQAILSELSSREL